MSEITTDAVAAALDAMRKEATVFGWSDADADRLLVGYDALLKLAADWDAKGAEIIAQIELQDCDGALAAFKMIGGQRFQDCAKELRSAISRALLGEENTDA